MRGNRKSGMRVFGIQIIVGYSPANNGTIYLFFLLSHVPLFVLIVSCVKERRPTCMLLLLLQTCHHHYSSSQGHEWTAAVAAGSLLVGYSGFFTSSKMPVCLVLAAAILPCVTWAGPSGECLSVHQKTQSGSAGRLRWFQKGWLALQQQAHVSEGAWHPLFIY